MTNQNNEKGLPRIDLPENWVVGTDITPKLLNQYANYPIRLRCEITALVMSGFIEATINTNVLQLGSGDLVTLMPGTIFQINRIEGEVKVYFLGFSADFISKKEQSRPHLDTLFFTLGRPSIHLAESSAVLMEHYLQLLIHLYNMGSATTKEELAPNVYADIHKGIALIYRQKNEQVTLSKAGQTCRLFVQLVIRHYQETRNVAWYAERLKITHAHLCTIVRQMTGRTCVDIISSMVIMDAKSQLKSTSQSIQEIADSLNFANMSFFGKYFKRYVGMSPLEYRNNG